MANLEEVIIVSDSESKDVHCSMFHLENGTLLENYKEGHSRRHTLDIISNNFVISAFEDKPKIKIWTIGHSNFEYHTMTLAGNVSALAVSKCSQYCVAGIGPSVYVWELDSGNLDAVLQFHMQDITCVKFSSNGSHFLTGGKDGKIFVTLLTEAIKKRNSPADVVKPKYTWSNHTDEITDIHTGFVQFYCWVATASIDRTSRIYDTNSGNLLYTVHMKVALSSVTMDFREMREFLVFLGTVEGNIYQINLFDTPDPELQFEDVAEQNAFVGHKKEITSLCVSFYGNYLVSGSRDKQCRIWATSSFTCVRQITFPGPVTNVIISLVPEGITNKNFVPTQCIQKFKKSLTEEDDDDDDDPRIYLHPENLSL